MRIRSTLLTISVIALTACSQSSGGDACATGEACTCSDGAAGTQVCRADGTFAACACAGASAEPDAGACPVYSVEYCDGLDNDCNGEVDDGEVCPDATVAHTAPFTGGVYFQGTTNEGTCGTDALQRFWPTLATTYFNGFNCYGRWYRFRRSDSAIYYHATFSGIRQNNDTDDPVVSTPPCNMDVGTYFDFDAAGTLHYQCSSDVHKGNGELVVQSAALVAAFDDGRVLVTRAGSGGTDFAVLDGSGNELSRLSPFAELTGTLTPLREATTVTGNRAYVAYRREYPSRKKEIVVFLVDESSAWTRVRRAEVPDFGYAQLVLSDGTIFVRERDPDNKNEPTERIVALLPDGTTRVAWREAEASVVRAHIGRQLLIGPP